MRDQIIFQRSTPVERRQGISRQSLATGLQGILHNNVRRNELIVHYQPRIDKTSGRITGVEALARWHHPHLGQIEPERFIPVAEETGMITELGEWVLFTALATKRQWNAANLKSGKMSVNVSPRQLTDPAFADMVERLLDTTDVEPTEVELEITESTRLDDMDQALKTMKRLGEQGVCFAMDDFGAGYASLDYLRKLPITSVKIDQSFVRNIDRGKQDAILVKGMIALAADLGLRVVAEGIEKIAQLDVLRPLACDEFQGFLFSRPMASDKTRALLSTEPVYAT